MSYEQLMVEPNNTPRSPSRTIHMVARSILGSWNKWSSRFCPTGGDARAEVFPQPLVMRHHSEHGTAKEALITCTCLPSPQRE